MSYFCVMKKIKKIGIALFLGLLVFVVVLFANALSVRSKQMVVPIKPLPELKSGYAGRLSGAIQIPTINYEDHSRNDTLAFRAIINYLRKTYSLADSLLEPVLVNKYSLLYRWKGKNPTLKPVLYMAHLDVVPVEKEIDWTYPPFSGQIAEGYIWGRGSMDVKNLVCAMLEAAELLLAKGFQPERDIYFAMGHDEETGGLDGNAKIADYLRSKSIRFEYILDEGLFILSGVFPGISKPTALIGIAEKGSLTLQLKAISRGGHASNPPRDNAVALLSNALNRIHQKGFRPHISGATRTMFSTLVPEMSLPYNILFGNLWIFEPLIITQLDNPPTMSTIRTTVAPTILAGSQKSNVLPQEAKAVLDLRLLPGETQKSALEHIRNLVGDERVQVEPIEEINEIDNPSPISCVECPAYELIHRSIRETFDNVIVAPGLFVARSDSKYYISIADNIYRFNPLQLSGQDIIRFHGTDERISIENYSKIIHFYLNLFEKN